MQLACQLKKLWALPAGHAATREAASTGIKRCEMQQHCMFFAGGYFIATVPDGKRIKAHLQKANGYLQKEQLILKQKWQVSRLVD